MSKNLEAVGKVLLVLRLVVAVGHSLYVAALSKPRTDKWVIKQLNAATETYYACYERGAEGHCPLPDYIKGVRTGEVVALTATANTGNRYTLMMRYQRGIGSALELKCEHKRGARPCLSLF